jgi:hypothetical protein
MLIALALQAGSTQMITPVAADEQPSASSQEEIEIAAA